jgi:glucosamine--fructose-6-phosphate aminotransferase (isomerizing)
VLTGQGRAVAGYFEELARLTGDAKTAANWVTNQVLATLKERKQDVADFPLSPERLAGLIAELKSIPSKIEAALSETAQEAAAVAESTAEREFFLYLGRHIGLPVCLEGALKLKEISYIPTDAYAAGELKHGPFALLDESTPVVCVATESPVLDKVLSNVEEVRARGAETIAIATEGDERVGEVSDRVIFVPRSDWILQPILAILPLQLLAYDIARRRGLNVDQPRNLAKTVTVE